MKRIGKLFVLLAVCAVVGIIVSSLVMVVYPGSFRLTAPVLCPSDQPNGFVVRYGGTNGSGESTTNFTLFCMDERGQFTEVGSWRPLGLLFVTITAGVFVLFLLVGAYGALFRRDRSVELGSIPEDSDSPAPAPASRPRGSGFEIRAPISRPEGSVSPAPAPAPAPASRPRGSGFEIRAPISRPEGSVPPAPGPAPVAGPQDSVPPAPVPVPEVSVPPAPVSGPEGSVPPAPAGPRGSVPSAPISGPEGSVPPAPVPAPGPAPVSGPQGSGFEMRDPLSEPMSPGASQPDGPVARLPDGTRAQVQDLVNQGKTIAAIKKIRDDTGMGLRDAKHAVDALKANRPRPS